MDSSLKAIELNPSAVQIKVGEYVQIKLTDLPDRTVVDPEWIVNNSDIASILVSQDGRSAIIRGLAEGQTVLTVTDGDISSETAFIRVYEDEETGIISKVVLDKSAVLLDLATEEFPTVEASVYIDGVLDPTADVTFSLVDSEGSPISFVQSGNTAVLTKISEGEAVLRATATGTTTKGVEQTVWSDCYVNVIDSGEVSLRSIALNPSSVQIMVGETAQMSLEDLPRGLSQNPEWSAEDPDLVSITASEDGRSVVIRGLAAGETFIKVADGEIFSDNAFIKILENAETGIINKVVLDKSAIMLDMAKEELSTVTATVYIDGIMDPAAEVTFSLVDPEGAPVGLLQNGNTAILSKLETGEAVLRATITGSTSKGVEQTLWSDCYVYVIDSTSPAENPTYTELASIVLNQRNLLLSRGESYLLTASIVPENARDVELEWSSDDPEIATVSADGLVTGRAAGQTIIRVSDVNTGINASCSVTVSGDAVRGVAQILLVPYSVNLQQDDDEPKTITARVLDEDGNELSATVTWDVEPILGIADVTIDGNTLSLLPLSAGSGYVKASCSGYSAKALVTTGEEKTILFGLTGTGYFDLVAYQKYHDGQMDDYVPTDEELKQFRARLPKV